jgi:hypothetical protein
MDISATVSFESGENMRMQVAYRLTRIRPVIDAHSEACWA